jgi:hypothetical protein
MEMYLIWSNEHNAWWRPNRKSYTVDIEKAGRYSIDEAITICNEANYGSVIGEDLPNELPISENVAYYLKGSHFHHLD